jgi:DNA-binding transcriptional MerR regulator
MADAPTFTLAEVARRFEVPQHRLIHLCEKGVVVPDVHDATGRGSSRVFSARNVLELAVALRVRNLRLPLTVAGAIVHVLRALEQKLQEDVPHFSLVASLRGRDPLDLRAIVSDGRSIYFSIGKTGDEPRLFGGVPLEPADGEPGQIQVREISGAGTGFGGPEGSQFARMELSVTAVGQALPID